MSSARRALIGILAPLAVLSAAGAAPDTDVESRLSVALDTLAARSGCTRSQLTVDAAALELQHGAAGRLPLASYLLREPERTEGTLTAVARDLREAPRLTDRLDLLLGLYRPEPEGLRALRELDPELQGPLTSPHPIHAAMEALYAKTGERFHGKEEERVRRDEANLEPRIARLVAQLLMASLHAERERDAWVRAAGLEQGGLFGGKSRRTARELRRILEEAFIDSSAAGPALPEGLGADALLDLWGHGRDLTAQIEAVLDSLVSVPASTPFRYEWWTPRGTVVVAGSGDDHHESSALLVLDLGGDDTYRGPGAVSGDRGVSVVIDLEGNDSYDPADSGLVGPGGAVLGFAMVADRGDGRDVYTGASGSLGFGFLGLGWLWDAGGNDLYASSRLGQGAGVRGAGLLVDSGGDDRYVVAPDAVERCGRAQGYAEALGVGLLLDVAGNDKYGTAPVPPGLHAVQGVSRAQGRTWGGLGVFVDGGGDDRYQGGVFAQGVGDGGGLGALIDLQGHDVFRATGEAQGYGTRTGVGAFLDGEGQDVHETGEWTLGVGQELGLGIAVDREGNDRFTVGGMSLGATSGQGAGWFLDLGGADSVDAPEGSMSVEGLSIMAPVWRTTVPGVAVCIGLGTVFTPEGQVTGVRAPRAFRRARGGAVFWPTPAGRSTRGTGR